MALWIGLDSQFYSHLIKCKVDKISGGWRNRQLYSLKSICNWKCLWVGTALLGIHQHRLCGCLRLSSMNGKIGSAALPQGPVHLLSHFLARHYVWALNVDLKGTIPWMHQTKQQPLILNFPGAGEKKSLSELITLGESQNGLWREIV